MIYVRFRYFAIPLNGHRFAVSLNTRSDIMFDCAPHRPHTTPHVPRSTRNIERERRGEKGLERGKWVGGWGNIGNSVKARTHDVCFFAFSFASYRMKFLDVLYQWKDAAIHGSLNNR